MSSEVTRYFYLLQELSEEVFDPEVTFTLKKATCMLEETEALYHKADTLTDNLVAKATTVEEEEKYLDIFEPLYELRRELKVTLMTIIRKCTEEPNSPPHTPSSKVKLPKATAYLEPTKKLYHKAVTNADHQLQEAATIENEKQQRMKLEIDLRTSLRQFTPAGTSPPPPSPYEFQLPKIYPPTLHEDSTALPSIKDKFEEAAERNTTITDGQKLPSLKSSRPGKPLKLIQELPINVTKYRGSRDFLSATSNYDDSCKPTFPNENSSTTTTTAKTIITCTESSYQDQHPIMRHPGTPAAQNAISGWAISAPAPTKSPDTIETYLANCEEESPKMKFSTGEEKYCEDHFVKTHTRTEDGRYVVRIPFKPTKASLGASRDQALRRFLQTERKILKSPDLFQQNSDFIKEYEDLRHLQKIHPPLTEIPGKTFHFPHHAVVNESSTTTKLRVVFDGSARTTSGLSFNDVVYT